MSLREKMNENPQVAMGIAGGVVLLALIWIFSNIFGGGGIPTVDPANAQLYYSTDDGATYTPGPAADRMKPGTVQARVFSIDDGTTLFVGYLERWTEEGVKAFSDLEAAIKANKADEVKRLDQIVSAGREVKRPKGATWVKSNAPQATAILNVQGPKGEDAMEMYPPAKQ